MEIKLDKLLTAGEGINLGEEVVGQHTYLKTGAQGDVPQLSQVQPLQPHEENPGQLLVRAAERTHVGQEILSVGDQEIPSLLCLLDGFQLSLLVVLVQQGCSVLFLACLPYTGELGPVWDANHDEVSGWSVSCVKNTVEGVVTVCFCKSALHH